jgi:hypothetical protein
LEIGKMNKQQLQQEIAELQKQLEEKKKALSVMPDKWEPEGGEFMVSADGDVSQLTSYAKCRLFGMEYATREQAEKASKAMRAHNRLLAYVAEFVTCGWEADWLDAEQAKYYASFSCKHMCWDPMAARETLSVGVVYMPRYAAEDLCNKLNSGEVQL